MLDISVIIPCFNHERYISKCLESVFYSCSSNLQVIVCDDCSTDNSFSIAQKVLTDLKKLDPERFSFVLIRNDKNQGVCKTLNICIEHVKGSYVYLTASDDYPLLNSIDFAVDEIQRKKTDILISDCVVVGGDGDVLYSSALFEYRNGDLKSFQSGFIKSELVTNWILPGPVALMKSDIFLKVGKYDENLMVEDRDFYLRVFSKCTVGFSSAKIAAYRVHDSNFSRNKALSPAIKSEIRMVNLKYRKNFNFICYLYLSLFYFYGFTRFTDLILKAMLFSLNRINRLFSRVVFYGS